MAFRDYRLKKVAVTRALFDGTLARNGILSQALRMPNWLSRTNSFETEAKVKSANEVLHEFIETPRGHYPDAELEYEREIFRSDPSAEFARQIRQCVARKLSVRELSACIREHSSDLRDLDEEGFSVIDGAQQIINRVVKGELNEDEAPIPLMNLLQTRRLFG